LNIKRIFDDIGNTDKSLVSSQLADLSQATPADIPSFKTLWVTIEAQRRRQVVNRLIDLARDNVELNFDIIFRFLLSDSDADVRMAAIDGLWENEDPSFVKLFIYMLNNDRSDKVKAAAASALGRFVGFAECGQIRAEYRNLLSNTLLSVINNAGLSIDIRRRALESVASITLPAVREAIKTAYESRDERFTVSSIFAMGRTCDKSWLPIILKELNNPNAEIRYEAAGACGEIGSEECVAPLLQRANDSDTDVQLAVIQSLGMIGGKEAKRELQKLAATESEAVKEAIAEALSEIETTEEMTLFEMKVPGSYDDKRN
jgi:HEAT repeat protein